MYEIIEFYDSNGYDLKEVLKSCIYKYYMANKKLLNTIKIDEKNSIIDITNQVKVFSNERS